MPPKAPTTPRRSKRFQPIPNQITHNTSLLSAKWPDEGPILIRRVKPEVDYDEDEIAEHQDEEEDGEKETAVYNRVFRLQRKRVGKGVKETKEEFTVGDTILVNVFDLRLRKTPSIGVIVAMWEVRDSEEEEAQDEETMLDRMKIRVRWFVRPSELPREKAERKFAKNEVYFTLDATAIISPSAIEGHCIVNGTPCDETEVFCQKAMTPLRCICYDIDWEEKRRTALEEQDEDWSSYSQWNIEPVETSRKRATRRSRPTTPKSARKRAQRSPKKREAVLSSDEEEEDDDLPTFDSRSDSGTEITEPPSSDEHDEEDDFDKDDEEPESEGDELISDSSTPRKRKRGKGASTPSRKRSRSKLTTTPRRRRTASRAQPTPHSKQALRKRAKNKQSLSNLNRICKPDVDLDYNNKHDEVIRALPNDAWLRALHMLHIGNRPKGTTLPCRNDEFNKILASVHGILEEGIGGCVYVSGVPGTGKTATVHAVIRELKRMAEQNETNPFTYVEINGLKLAEPAAAYSLLWESLVGDDDDDPLTRRTRSNNKESLHSLTKYFSKRSRGPAEHACIVLMDELDQLMTTDQDVIYNFFNWPMLSSSRLIVLAVANTMDLPERVMTGRVRSRLGMVRINFQPYTTKQLEEIVKSRLEAAKKSFDEDDLKARQAVIIDEDAIKYVAMKTASVSGDARRTLDVCRRAIELVQPLHKTAKTSHVREIILSVQSSPAALYVKDCTFHERVMLAAVIKCVKRTGVDEVKWSEVQDQHQTYSSALTCPTGTPHRTKLTSHELRVVLNSLVSSRALLIDRGSEGAGRGGGARDTGERKLLLNVDTMDVERVLTDGKGGQMWRNLLG